MRRLDGIERSEVVSSEGPAPLEIFCKEPAMLGGGQDMRSLDVERMRMAGGGGGTAKKVRG